MDPSVTGLRVLRAVAELGSFSAVAATLGYTQSAVSRQVAALEAATGVALCERQPRGVRLTAAGRAYLAHAGLALDALDAAGRALAGLPTTPVELRLGMYVSAGAGLVPRALASLRARRPELVVSTREGTTPALVRALRAGVLDLALLTARPPYRPPDAELPRLRLRTLATMSLRVAVPADGAWAGRTTVTLAELADRDWVASPETRGEPLLGVWPGLPGRPRVRHAARDWLAKLQLVAAGCGITTIPVGLALPAGVRALEVVDGAPELRRVLLAFRPGRLPAAVGELAEALQGAADATLA